MSPRLPLVLLLSSIGHWGCETESSAAADPIEDSTVSTDAGFDADAADAAPDATVADASADASPVDGSQPDAAPPSPVDTCEAACDRVMACERTDLYPDHAACLTACEAASRNGPPAAFFECLSVEACNLLHLCRLPEPPALTCEQAAERFEACLVDPLFDTSVAACEAMAAPRQDALRACAEHLDAACDVDAFEACFTEQVFPECSARCGTTIGCNLERANSCQIECLTAQFSDDPLTRLHLDRSNTCLAQSTDCQGADRCLNPQVLGPAPTDDQLCDLWAGCGLEALIACDAGLNLMNTEAARRCVFDRLSAGCPGDPFGLLDCQNAPDVPGLGCADYCAAANACAAEPAPGCRAECAATPAEEINGRIICADQATCPAFDACVEAASPLAACAAHCEQLAGCELAPEGCVQTCLETFYFDRQQATITCVDGADECQAMAACLTPMDPSCAPLCERVSGCQLDPEPACLRACDDAAFANPGNALNALSCVASAPHCTLDESVEGCPLDAPANRCVRFCEGSEDPVACVVACGEGLSGAEHLAFLTTAECLAAGGEGCQTPTPDCAPFCGAIVGCGLADEGCAERCADDPLLQLRAIGSGDCVSAAGEACDAVAACLTPPVPDPIDIGDDAFCTAYEACGYEAVIPCAVALQLVGDAGPAARECAIRRMQTDCPESPLDLQACLNEGSPDLAACRSLCDDRALCGLDETPRDDCHAECVQAAFGPPDIAPLLVCQGALECAALTACLEE